MISKIFITNYIGGLIIEKTYSDFWIINGLENYLSHLFLNKLYNNNYRKIKLYKWLLKLKKECKKGKETLPLYTNNYSNPVEIQLNPIFNLKSKILFFILESKVSMKYIQEVIKDIINKREIEGYNISTQILIDKFKELFGIDINNFIELYVYRTGMLEININYKYDINNNIFEYNIKMENISKKYYEKNPYFYIGNIDYEYLNKIGNNIIVIDSRVKPNIFNNIKLNMEIIQRDGREIKKMIHQINSNITNEKLLLKINSRNSDLTKIEEEFLYKLIKNTGINKIYKNEEIIKILSQNIIFWIKNDSELSSLRINNIKQQHILYDYIKIFIDENIFGKLESLYNIGKDKDNYEKSIEFLKYFIKDIKEFKQIKNYAIKIYVKIIIKLNKIEEYLFLLEMLDNYFNELLKDKTHINLNIYYIMIEIINILGEFEEKNFINISSYSLIKDKIADKFLNILSMNDLDNYLKFDNCYFISNIILICSKFHLNEKSFVLLDIILKILRIEKLKRSFNEILIISSLIALINLLIKNNFYSMKTDIRFKETLSQIFFEINFFINNDSENYELIVTLKYFEIFMEFYKCQSYIEFSNYMIKYILGEEYNNIIKMSNFSLKQNLNIISKIKALDFFVNNNNLIFDSLDEKIIFISSLKTILYSPISYLREDCKYILENIYQIFFSKEISLKGAGNKNFNNINFLHLLNKNRINYTSKKYADKDWLLSFINKDNLNINIKKRIEEYNIKYKNKNDDIFNLEINTKKSFNEILLEVFKKLIEYSQSENYLGDLYKKEEKDIIIKNIDFNSIKEKIINKDYLNLNQFNKDIFLILDKHHLFKNNNVLNNKIKQLKEYYEIIIFLYKTIINIKEKEEKNDQVINHKAETIKIINGDDKDKNFLNKKRNLKEKK